MINVSTMKMQLEGDRCCMLLSRGTCAISANIIVNCKRLHYVKSIVKDDKNVLKPKTILQKSDQDSKWRIQNIINRINCSAVLVIVNFQITFGLIGIAQ